MSHGSDDPSKNNYYNSFAPTQSSWNDRIFGAAYFPEYCTVHNTTVQYDTVRSVLVKKTIRYRKSTRTDSIHFFLTVLTYSTSTGATMQPCYRYGTYSSTGEEAQIKSDKSNQSKRTAGTPYSTPHPIDVSITRKERDQFDLTKSR